MKKTQNGLALRNSKGFTLIELLAVIAIIGILATLILVSLSNARKQARDVQRKSTVRAIAQAEESYYNSNSSYVTGNSALASLATAGFINQPSNTPWKSTGVAGTWSVVVDNGGYKVGTCLESNNTKGFECKTGGNCSDIASGCSY